MTRWMVLLAAVAIAVLAPPAAPRVSAQDDLSSPKLRIAWDQFKKLHDSGKVIVVDVRDEVSFANGHIPGAMSIPLDQTEKRVKELKKSKLPIVTYCA